MEFRTTIDLSEAAGGTEDYAIGSAEIFSLISVQGVQVSVNNTGATFTLIESNDGENWEEIKDAKGDVFTFTTGATSDVIELFERERKFNRFGVRVTATGGTTGTVQLFGASVSDPKISKENHAKYKMLGQLELTTAAQAVYTVPANVEAVALCIIAANTSNSTKSYILYADNTNGNTWNDTTTLLPDIDVLKNTADKQEGFFVLDVEGATFAAEASVSGTVTLTIFGKEYYKERQ